MLAESTQYWTERCHSGDEAYTSIVGLPTQGGTWERMIGGPRRDDMHLKRPFVCLCGDGQVEQSPQVQHSEQWLPITSPRSSTSKE